MIKRHPDFHFIAAANTYGSGATLDYVGRNPLDAATLNRFVFTPVDYDEKLERAMVIAQYGDEYNSWVTIVQTVRRVARDMELRHIISPRSSRDGAKLLKGGLDKAFAFNSTVLRELIKDKDSLVKLNKKLETALKEDFKAIDLQSNIIDINKHSDIEKQIEKARGFLDAIDDLSERVNNTTGFRKSLVNLLVGKPKHEEHNL